VSSRRYGLRICCLPLLVMLVATALVSAGEVTVGSASPATRPVAALAADPDASTTDTYQRRMPTDVVSRSFDRDQAKAQKQPRTRAPRKPDKHQRTLRNVQDQGKDQGKDRGKASRKPHDKAPGKRHQAHHRTDRTAPTSWVLPVSNYHLSATFGEVGYLWSSVHTGLDFAAPYGSPIVSVAHGTVTEAAYDGSYGYKTVVTLDDGTEIWYCHQTSNAVGVGAVVDPGELIGYVGATGNTTGPHLHLEVSPGGGPPVDPYTVLVSHGVQP